MLSWLDHFWNNVRGSVGDAISTAVHWAMHAIMSVILAVFRLVGKAWTLYVDALRAQLGALEYLARETWSFASWLTRGYLPRLVHWAATELGKLRSYALFIWRELVKAAAFLRQLITKTAREIYLFILRDVWDPLKRYADQIWNDLKKWGYVAWWWITHLPNLAEALIMHIVVSLEKHAWEIAAQLGKFFLSLIFRNLKRVTLLIEDILTAVF